MVETLTILLLRIPQTHLSPSLSSNASAATKHRKLAASTAKLDERRRYKQRRRTDVKPEKRTLLVTLHTCQRQLRMALLQTRFALVAGRRRRNIGELFSCQ